MDDKQWEWGSVTALFMKVVKQKCIIVNKCQRNLMYNAHIFLSLVKAFTRILKKVVLKLLSMWLSFHNNNNI